MSVIFLVAVLVNTAVVPRRGDNNQLGLLAVAPLLVRLATGTYLFVQPYLAQHEPT